MKTKNATWILINGEIYLLNQKISLLNLFNFLGQLKPGLINEYNQKITTPDLAKTIFLKNSDRIEFITIVGGG